jgi:hypothetical protein
MTQPDLKTLERDAFRKSYEDGLFDMFLGIVLALTAVSSVIDRVNLSGGASLVVTIALYGSVTGGMIWLRHRVVRRRLGAFKPGKTRMRRIRATRLVLAASVALGLIAAALPALGKPPDGIAAWVPFILLANSVIVFGSMAYFLDVPRFFLYGFLFPVPFFATIWFRPLTLAEALLAYGAPVAIIVGIGVYKLTRFLRDYPVTGAS